jgi:membrane fusion protein (multidrug efflux system)
MTINFNKIALFGVFSLFLFIMLGMHYYQWRQQLRYPETQLGQIKANIIPVLAPINGPITTIYAKQHSLVKRGDLLVQIDPTPYQAAINSAQNNLLRIKEEVKKAQNTVNAIEKEVEKNQAELSEIAKMAFQIQTLVENRELPKSANVEANTQLKIAGDALESSFEQLDRAYVQLGKRGSADSNIKSAEAALRQAKLNLSFTEIASPTNGYVSDLTIKLGNQVMARQPILFLVENNEWWVEAIFKPIQMKLIKINQKATIKLNPYSDISLHGSVDSIEKNIVKIRLDNSKLDLPLQVGAHTNVTIDTTSSLHATK